MIFDVVLPPMFPVLALQLWDYNFIAGNEALGLVTLDLKNDMLKAKRHPTTEFHVPQSWVPVMDTYEVGKVIGELEVEIHIRHQDMALADPIRGLSDECLRLVRDKLALLDEHIGPGESLAEENPSFKKV